MIRGYIKEALTVTMSSHICPGTMPELLYYNLAQINLRYTLARKESGCLNPLKLDFSSVSAFTSFTPPRCF